MQENTFLRGISICLSDIPLEAIQVSSKNGKQYVNLMVGDKKEKDVYDQDVAVWIQQSKEQREAKETRKFVGNGKKMVPAVQNPATHPFQQQAVTQAAPQQQSDGNTAPPLVDDLPF